jgi:hypothetical protein
MALRAGHVRLKEDHRSAERVPFFPRPSRQFRSRNAPQIFLQRLRSNRPCHTQDAQGRTDQRSESHLFS